MNPLASTKFVRRVFMALAAIAGIFLAVGCGGSSTPPANPVGFSTSTLNGTYVFASQGADASGYPLALAGTFVANGSGAITGGTIDIVDEVFDVSGNTPPATAAQAITGGSYTVGTDGRGQATLKSAYGTSILDFVLTSSSHGLVTEYDGNGGGSGTIDLQSAVTSLNGSYAFSLAGSDANGNTFATAGAFTLSSGSITAGVEDFNDNLIVVNQPLTGAASLGSGTGPGSMTLTTSSFPLTFDFYPIDSTHFKLVETDYSNFLVGDVFTQTSTSIPTGTMAFTMEGGVSAPIADGGFLTYNGSSFTGTEDVNSSGTVLTQVAFTGLPGAAGAVGGRVVVTLSDFNPASQWVVYPSTGGLLMLETDSTSVTAGAAYVQTAGAALATSQAYGFNLSALNAAGYEENDIAQFTTTSTGFSGVIDVDDNFGNGGAIGVKSYTLGGTYTLDSPATGRGEATTTANNSDYINFIFYAVSSSQFLLLETDTSSSSIGAQVGAGTFEAQTTPGAAAAAQSRISLARPMVHAHAAKQRK